MKDKAARAVGERLNGALRRQIEEQSTTIEDLRARVAALEEGLADARRHQHRVAELTDVVTELLVPLSARDQDKVDEILARYVDELGS